MPQLLLLLADRKTRHALLEEERGDAPRAQRRVHRREDDDDVGVVAVGAPLLGAVKHVTVARETPFPLRSTASRGQAGNPVSRRRTVNMVIWLREDDARDSRLAVPQSQVEG